MGYRAFRRIIDMTNMQKTIEDLIRWNKAICENLKKGRDQLSRYRNKRLTCETRGNNSFYRIIETNKQSEGSGYAGNFRNSKDVQDIAAFQYYKRAADQAVKNIKMLEELARNIVDVDPNVFPETLPNAYQMQPQKIFEQTGIISIDEWINRPRVFSNRNPEEKIHDTKDGWKVRSKSEVMWADSYSEMNIPYVYETEYMIDGYRIAPDFDALNTRTYKEYFHEHFGKMDDLNYVQNNFLWRLFHYMRAGLKPGVDLIMTYESKSIPLTREIIQATLMHYFG